MMKFTLERLTLLHQRAVRDGLPNDARIIAEAIRLIERQARYIDNLTSTLNKLASYDV